MNLLITQMLLEHRLSALLQLHFHARLDIWLQWVGQRQLQDDARIISLLTFGASYIRDLTVCFKENACMSQVMIQVMILHRNVLSNEDSYIGKYNAVTMVRRDHSGYELSQWEEALLCNASSHEPIPRMILGIGHRIHCCFFSLIGRKSFRTFRRRHHIKSIFRNFFIVWSQNNAKFSSTHIYVLASARGNQSQGTLCAIWLHIHVLTSTVVW